jgi:hypothetical protein
MLKLISLSYLGYCRIWVNLHVDDRHFGYITKLINKKHWDSDPGSLFPGKFIHLVPLSTCACTLSPVRVAFSCVQGVFLCCSLRASAPLPRPRNCWFPSLDKNNFLLLLLSWSLKFRFLLKISLIVTSILWQVLLNKCVSHFRLLRLLALASSVLTAFPPVWFL